MPGNKKKHKKKKNKAGGVTSQVGSRLDVLNSSNSSASSIDDSKEDSKQESSPVNLPANFLVVPLPEAKAALKDREEQAKLEQDIEVQVAQAEAQIEQAQSELEQQVEVQVAQAEAQIEQAQDVVTKMPEFDVGSNLNAVVFAAMVKDAPEELPTFYRDKPEEYTFTRKDEPMNLLHISAYFGAVNMTKWLLSTGKFDIDEPTCNGKSALWFAIRYDNEPLTSFKDLLRAWVNRKSEVFKILLIDNDANASFEPVEGLGGLWDILFELYDDLLKNNLQLHSYKFIAPLLEWDEANIEKPTILQHGFNAPHDFHYKRLLSLTEGSSSFLIPRIMDVILNKLTVFDLEAETSTAQVLKLREDVRFLELKLADSQDNAKRSAESMSKVVLLEEELAQANVKCEELTSELKKKDKELGKKGKIAGESSELQANLLKAQKEIESLKASSKTGVTKAGFDQLKQEYGASIKYLEDQVSQFKPAKKALLAELAGLFKLRDRQASELELLKKNNSSLSEKVSVFSRGSEAKDALLKEVTVENRILREKLQFLEVIRSESMASRDKLKQLEASSSQLKKMIARTASDKDQKYNKRESELLSQIYSQSQQLSEKDQMISYQQQQLQESQYKDQMIFDLYSQLQGATSERDTANYSASQAQIFADSLGQQLGDLTRSKSLPENTSLVKIDREYQDQLSDLRRELLSAKSELSIAKFNLSKRDKPEASGAGSFVMAQAADGASGAVVEAGF